MELKDTQTMENLRKALAGESIARNKYTYFAQVARDNGDLEIAEAFEQMARNEMTHARLWFELVNGGLPKTTRECLMLAAQGEYNEWYEMYPDFAKQARADGLEEIAVMFEKVAGIERSHENRFLMLLARQGKASGGAAPAAPAPAPKTKKEGYRCQFCGAIFENRPDVCDTCGAIGAFDYVQYYE